MITWRAAVGDDSADEASRKGMARGNRLHGLMEAYVRGEAPDSVASKREQVAFLAARREVDRHLTKVNAVEVILYSKALLLAGTCDLVGCWDREPAIIDYKTSSSPKGIHEIEDYFIQETAYSVMVEELTGERHEQLVVVMANVDDPIATVHVRRRSQELIDRLCDARDLYAASRGEQ